MIDKLISFTVYSWKLGREPSIPELVLTDINTVIDSVQVLSQQYYVPRDHSEEACFYYPDNNGGDVILNGQCIPDAEVPAVPNFQANVVSTPTIFETQDFLISYFRHRFNRFMMYV